ncbi:hypothetical protein IKN40_01020 [bacterium]|nr:hypothetical protein [bacterium]
MKTIEFYWKSITEIPIEHWSKNNAISPTYLVRCGVDKYGLSILGYSNYSFVTNKWIPCCNTTNHDYDTIYEVTEWTDIKI